MEKEEGVSCRSQETSFGRNTFGMSSAASRLLVVCFFNIKINCAPPIFQSHVDPSPYPPSCGLQFYPGFTNTSDSFEPQWLSSHLHTFQVTQLTCTSTKSQIGASVGGMCFCDRTLGLHHHLRSEVRFPKKSHEREIQRSVSWTTPQEGASDESNMLTRTHARVSHNKGR
jgi:hypothetical protein